MSAPSKRKVGDYKRVILKVREGVAICLLDRTTEKINGYMVLSRVKNDMSMPNLIMVKEYNGMISEIYLTIPLWFPHDAPSAFSKSELEAIRKALDFRCFAVMEDGQPIVELPRFRRN